jgi:hypothetical protein
MRLIIKSLLGLLALSLVGKLNVTDLSFRANCATVLIRRVVLVTRRVPLVALTSMLTFYGNGL